jgi:hypothetical protein
MRLTFVDVFDWGWILATPNSPVSCTKQKTGQGVSGCDIPGANRDSELGCRVDVLTLRTRTRDQDGTFQ